MNEIKFYFSVLSMILVLSGCNPSDGKKKEQDETQTFTISSEISVVEEIVEEIYTAMINKDGAELSRLCAEGLSYGHSSGLVQDKAKFIDDVLNGPFTFLSISPQKQSVEIVGKNAIVRHIFLSQAKSNGQEIEIRIGCVQVYKSMAQGEWQLLVRQAYKL